MYVSVQFVNDDTGPIALHTDLSLAEATTSFAWEKTADKTYKITSSDKSLPGETYTLSDNGKTLSSSTGLIVLNKA